MVLVARNKHKKKGRSVSPFTLEPITKPKIIEKLADKLAKMQTRPQIQAKKFEIAQERARGAEERSLVGARTAGLEQGLAASEASSKQIADTLRARMAESRKGALERLAQEEESTVGAARQEAESRQQQYLPEQEQKVRAEFAARRKQKESEADISGTSGEQQASAGQQAAAQTRAAGAQYAAEAKGGVERKHQKAVMGLRSELATIKGQRGALKQEIGMKLVERERAFGASIAQARAQAAAQMQKMQLDSMKLSELQRHNQALEGISAGGLQMQGARLAEQQRANVAGEALRGEQIKAQREGIEAGLVKAQAGALTAQEAQERKAWEKRQAVRQKREQNIRQIRDALLSGTRVELGKTAQGKPRTVGDMNDTDVARWIKGSFGYAPSVEEVRIARARNVRAKQRKEARQVQRNRDALKQWWWGVSKKPKPSKGTKPSASFTPSTASKNLPGKTYRV